MAPQKRPQPYPLTTIYSPIPSIYGAATCITRGWEEDAVGPNGDCNLCPECHAKNGICQVVAGETVQARDAPLYSLRDFIERTNAKPYADGMLRIFYPEPGVDVGNTAFTDELDIESKLASTVEKQTPEGG